VRQWAHVGVRQKVVEERQLRRVEPLHVVEEERQGMLRPGEDAEEAPEHQLEAPVRVLGRQLRDRWLVAEDARELGDEVDQELAVRAQCLPQGGAPTAQLGLARAEQWPHEALKRLRERRIRDVTLVLVELARREQAA